MNCTIMEYNIDYLTNICFSVDFIEYIYKKYQCDLININDNKKILHLYIKPSEIKYLPPELLSFININILKILTTITKIHYNNDNIIIVFNTNIEEPELLKNIIEDFNYIMIICFTNNNNNTNISIKTQYNYKKNIIYDLLNEVFDNFIRNYIISYLEEGYIYKLNKYIDDKLNI